MENMISDTDEKTRQKEKQKEQLNQDTIKFREEISAQRIIVDSRKQELKTSKDENLELKNKIQAKEKEIQETKEKYRVKEQDK